MDRLACRAVAHALNWRCEIGMKKEKKIHKEGVQPEQLLSAAERDSQNLFTGAFGFLLKNYRAGNQPSENTNDKVEKWGSRIGRTLGYVFALVLLVNLFTGWFF